MINWADPVNVVLLWLAWAIGLSLLAPGVLARPWAGAVLGAAMAASVVQTPVETSVLWIAVGFVLGNAAARILSDPLERLGLRAGTGAFEPGLRTSLSEGGWRAYRLAVAASGLLLLVSWLGLRIRAVPLGTFGGWDLTMLTLQLFGTRRATAGMSPQAIRDAFGGSLFGVWAWIQASIGILVAVWISAAALGSFDSAVRGLAVDLKNFAEAGNRWFWRYLLWGLALGAAFEAVAAVISLPYILLPAARDGQALLWRIFNISTGWITVLLVAGLLMPALALLVLGRPLRPLLRRRWSTLLIGGLIVVIARSVSYGAVLIYPAWTLYIMALSQDELYALGEGGAVGPSAVSEGLRG